MVNLFDNLVMHMCYLMANFQKNKEVFSAFNIFTITFSGLCHDVGHTGFTNAFMVASGSDLARTYNDRSVLENYHAHLTFEILRKPENNFLDHLKLQEFSQFRKDVIHNILYTDIQEHFPLLEKFNNLSGNLL